MQTTRDEMGLKAIGVVRTPFAECAGTPIQPSRAADARGSVEVLPEYAAGLKDLAGFDRIWLLYWLDRAPAERLIVTPFLDTQERGVFATRSPARPNPIGMSAVQLLGVNGNVLEIAGVDILDGTPLLDIKPYIREFDCHAVERSGWFDHAPVDRAVADDRFSRGSE